MAARLCDAFPGGYTTDRAAFCAALEGLGPNPGPPPGLQVLHTAPSGARVLRVPLSPGSPGLAWHARAAPLATFFIEAASPLDAGDPRWEMLACVAPRHCGATAAATPVGPTDAAAAAPLVLCGFATVYRFYAHPSGSRLRLAQLVVLPPLQRRGHAAALLDSLRAAAEAVGAADTTVEDPTPTLARLRDRCGLRAALADPSLTAAAAAAVAAAAAAAAAAEEEAAAAWAAAAAAAAEAGAEPMSEA